MYQRALPFKQNAKKIFDTFTIKQNAEKVPETKKEARRRTSQYVEGLLMKVYNALPLNQQNAEKVSETKRDGRRRTTATSRPSR